MATATADDIAQALARFAASVLWRPTAGGTPLAVTHEDLQAMWQVVSYELAPDGSAPAGELSAQAYEQLKALYNVLENAIISCGSIDTFDVYEVCFETMANMGFFIRCQSSKELLSQLLENVHEVYDVLLSCVETYEWVQPGATGLLRLWMFEVIFACFESDRITGALLMELTNNDVAGAVSLIAFILQCSQAPFDVQATSGRCLVELTSADSVFLTSSEEAGPVEELQNKEIEKLTGMLNRHVNSLIKSIIQFDLVEAFGRCICQHQMSHARTDIIVRSFLTTIHNCLLYCSENQKKLRQHLATQSTIVRDIILPYIDNILPALYDNLVCGPKWIEWQNLKAAMQTLTVVTFNINQFRPQLRDGDVLHRICQVPNLLTHITMLELLFKIAINVDFAKAPPPLPDDLATLLTAAFSRLSPESQARLQRRLTSERSNRLPFARSSVKSVELLAFALQSPPELQAPPPAPPPEEPDVAAPAAVARAPKAPFSMQQAPTEAAAPAEDSDDDMPPLAPGSNWQGAPIDSVGIPDMALCALSGAIMHDPVATPNGHVFERQQLEEWVANYAADPFAGTPLTMADVVEAPQVADHIRDYQMQALSQHRIAPQAHPPKEWPGPGLLGDLPTLNKKVEVDSPKNKKKEKGKIRITSRSVVDCPPEMCCAIDGKVMTAPVRSPYGHLFEKKTLERWFQNCGSVCPITGKPLRFDDCLPDSEMKKRIVHFLKGMQ